MKTIWNWVCRLFTKENVGIIWKTLFASAKNAAKKAINDPKVQAKAFETAKTLLSANISGDAKKDAFNSTMKDFFAEYGKEVGTSTLNCIRELAVEAAKEAQNQEADGGSTIAPCLFALVGLVLFGALSASAGTQCYVLKYGHDELIAAGAANQAIYTISPFDRILITGTICDDPDAYVCIMTGTDSATGPDAAAPVSLP